MTHPSTVADTLDAGPTPGPWELRYDYSVNIPYRGEHCCAVAYGGTEANARLIAAAPDLFEALVLLLQDYVSLSEEYGLDLIGSDRDPEVARARAAIAKARGEVQP